jgi:hypothetical protein
MDKQSRKSWLLILTALIIMMGLTDATWAAPGQNPHRDTVPYTLTVNVNPSGSGSVKVNPPGPYDHGDRVKLTANADPGWTFDHWSGDLSGSINPEWITMDGNKTVTANFEAIQHTLTMAVSPSGGGTTTPPVGTHDYDEGTVVNITATVAAGYQFVNWTGM